MWESPDPILEFWDPSNIARTVVARNFKFGTETKGGELERKKMQNWAKRGHVGDTWPNFGILGTPHISRTIEARKFKFGTQTEGGDFQRKKCKISSKGVMWGTRDPILEFWDPPISRGRLKLETSNLARRRTAASFNEKMQNWVKRGHVGDTWPNFGILETPLYLANDWS